ncbi:MAG: glycosyltransferase [candidate division WOR-3 bacterium]
MGLDSPKDAQFYLRVCLLTSSHPVKYSRFFDRESFSLSRAGFKVTLIGLGEIFSTTDINGIKLITVPERHGLGKWRLFKKIAFLARNEAADIYHCLDPWCLAIGLKIKRQRRNVAVIYESSEWFPRMYLDRQDFPLPLRWLGWLLVSYLEYQATKKADEILETNWSRSQRFLRRRRIPVQVPNYPPLELMGTPQTARKPWVVYTGLICRPRGFDRLLKALATLKKEFPEIRLLVLGDFDPRDDIEKWSKRFIAQENLADNVLFLPKTKSYPEIFDILKPCLAGVILLQPERKNDWTNQPNKLFEFMGCGLAVIASNFPEIAWVVKKEEAGWLINPKDNKALVSALANVLRNQSEAISRGLRGREAVIKYYNWQVAEKNLLNVYERLAANITVLKNR